MLVMPVVAAVNGGVADGVPDDLNASGTFDVGDFMTNSTWTGLPMTPEKIRIDSNQCRGATNSGRCRGFTNPTPTRALSTPNP